MFIGRKKLERMLEEERNKAYEQSEEQRFRSDVWNRVYQMESHFNDRLTALELATGLKKEKCPCATERDCTPKCC